jgi:hypothetical protein
LGAVLAIAVPAVSPGMCPTVPAGSVMILECFRDTRIRATVFLSVAKKPMTLELGNSAHVYR